MSSGIAPLPHDTVGTHVPGFARSRRLNARCGLAALACLGAIAAPAFAQVGGMMAHDAGAGSGVKSLEEDTLSSQDLQLTLGATHSDNITRAQTNKQSDTVATAGIIADTVRNGARLDYALQADLNWAEYLENTYTGQPFGSLDGSLNFAIVPARVFWDVRDTFNQVTLNPSQAVRPDNLESFNYFTTGPRAMIGLGQNLALTFFGTYSDVAYSSRSSNTEDADSQRYAAGTTLTRAISEQANAYVSFNTQKVEFKDVVIGVPDPDYTRQEAYVGYHVGASRTFVDVSAGTTRLEPDADGQKSTSSFLARLSLARKLTPSSTLRFNASQQVGDSADMTRSGFGRPTGDVGLQDFATSDPFRGRVYELGWDYRRARTSLSLTGTISEDRYGSATTLNRDSEQARAMFTRRLRPALDLNLVVSYLKEDFQNVSLVNKQLDEILALTWRAGRRLGVTFQYSHSKRDSDQGDGTSTENRIGAELSYSLLGS